MIPIWNEGPADDRLTDSTEPPASGSHLVVSRSDVVSYVRSTAASNLHVGRHAIVRETEGNPLFVGEVVRLLAVEGRSTAHSTQRGTLLPRGVREVIGRRLRHVSPECIEVLTLASVLGREFGLDALERLSQRPSRHW